ncbi:hypothetical protein ANCCAN_09758 [Ancylostoma caninum]|uniref:Uncharacterized protein n=1 Tax=Ancylostoma caninum TaxID=29170 RepID=A0A368GMG7_ANCCA|nr:hypothetical protein ANCCAN_09758 [Ancylostoma caninum]
MVVYNWWIYHGIHMWILQQFSSYLYAEHRSSQLPENQWNGSFNCTDVRYSLWSFLHSCHRQHHSGFVMLISNKTRHTCNLLMCISNILMYWTSITEEPDLISCALYYLHNINPFTITSKCDICRALLEN